MIRFTRISVVCKESSSSISSPSLTTKIRRTCNSIRQQTIVFHKKRKLNFVLSVMQNYFVKVTANSPLRRDDFSTEWSTFSRLLAFYWVKFSSTTRQRSLIRINLVYLRQLTNRRSNITLHPNIWRWPSSILSVLISRTRICNFRT